MGRKKELVKNTFIIFVGKFCTQFVTFLLVPIYTFYLTTSDYGYVDLIQTYISLLIPIVILRFDSAIFRFLIDVRNDEEEKTEIISSSIALIVFQIVLLIIVFLAINYFFNIPYWFAIILNIVFVSISSYLLQLTRGIGKNFDYSISVILSAVITIVLNLILIVRYKSNASSILYISAIANFICSLYLVIKNKIYQNVKLKSFSKRKIKEMLKYSLPMIPDGLSWWIVNVSDRTIIASLIGVSANGIYAVSCKFSNILSSIYQVFNMSWQESVSLHINDKDRDKFFSEVLNNTYVIFYSLCILILVCMPFLFRYFIGKEYALAYTTIPILLMGNLFNALANISGGIYIAKKETQKVARTTIIAAFINIVINLLFIKKFGLYAAAISTLISYIVLAIYRYIDVKKYVKMKINLKMFVITNLFFIVSSIVYYLNIFIFNVFNIIIVLIVVIVLNQDNIKTLFSMIRRKM